MTVASTIARYQYAGNGVTTNFAFGSLFLAAGDVQVILYDPVADATVPSVRGGAATYDYAVSGTQDAASGEYLAGANIVFNTAIPSGWRVTLLGRPAETQSFAAVPTAALPVLRVNTALDKTALIDQGLDDRVERAIRPPPYDLNPAMLLPSAKKRANLLLGFDASGHVQLQSPNFPTPSVPFTAPFTTPEQYDAKGDGATDDTTSLQAAITALNAQGAGILVLAAKTYLISAPLISTAPLKIIGAGTGMGAGPGFLGAGSVIKAMASFTAGHMLHITSFYGSWLDGVRFDSVNTRTSGAAVYLDTPNVVTDVTYNHLVENCGFNKQWDCIRQTDGEVPTIRRCLFEQWGNTAVWLDITGVREGSFGFIHNNNFFCIDAAGNPLAAFAAISGNGGYAFISDNVFIGANYAVNMTLDTHSVTTGTLLIKGNQFEEQLINSIAVARTAGSTAIFGNVQIIGNELANVSKPLLNSHINIQDDLVGTYVTNILVAHNTTTSFLTNSGAAHIVVNTGDNIVIDGNILHNHSAGAGVLGIVVNTPRVVQPMHIIDNLMKGFSLGKLYNCVAGSVVRDLSAQLRFADLGAAWNSGTLVYVSDGQATSGANMTLVAGGTGCLAWKQKGIYVTLPITG